MKSKFWTYTISVLLIHFVLSCNQNEEISYESHIDYKQIGIQHNQGLEEIFIELKTLKAKSPSGRINKADYIEVIQNRSIAFTLKNHPNLSSKSIDELKSQINNAKSSLKLFIKNRTNSRVSESGYFHDQVMIDIDYLLTPNQRFYANQIVNTVSSGSDINYVLASLNSIEQQIISNCSNDELPVLLSAVSVARSSSEYWHNNYSTWVTEFGDIGGGGGGDEFLDPARTMGKVDWGVVGAADVAQAVIAGTLTSTALVVPFIGWGAWGIITGGSALFVSGASALIYLAS